MKKHQPSLVAAITMPASDGPTRRATLTIEELIAIALERSARLVESVNDALKCAEREDFTDGDAIAERQPREHQGLHHGQRLRPHEHLPAVDAVDDDAGDRRQQEGGDLSGEAHGAK